MHTVIVCMLGAPNAKTGAEHQSMHDCQHEHYAQQVDTMHGLYLGHKEAV